MRIGGISYLVVAQFRLNRLGIDPQQQQIALSGVIPIGNLQHLLWTGAMDEPFRLKRGVPVITLLQ